MNWCHRRLCMFKKKKKPTQTVDDMSGSSQCRHRQLPRARRTRAQACGTPPSGSQSRCSAAHPAARCVRKPASHHTQPRSPPNRPCVAADASHGAAGPRTFLSRRIEQQETTLPTTPRSASAATHAVLAAINRY